LPVKFLLFYFFSFFLTCKCSLHSFLHASHLFLSKLLSTFLHLLVCCHMLISYFFLSAIASRCLLSRLPRSAVPWPPVYLSASLHYTVYLFPTCLMPGFPYSCPSVVCLSRTPSCLLTHLSRLLPPTCLSSISPCHTVYLLSSIVCTPVPPAHLLDPQTFLTFYLLPVCYSKVCCLLSRLLPLSSICCPLSALLSPPPPHPMQYTVYVSMPGSADCQDTRP